MSMESYLKHLELKIRLAKERAEQERRSVGQGTGLTKDQSGKWSYNPCQDSRKSPPSPTKI